MELSDLIIGTDKQVKLQKGDVVFNQGDIEHTFYFVKSGMLKATYVAEDGSEFIKSFILSGDLIGSLTSAHMNIPCTFSLICIKQCELVKIPFQILRQGSKSDLNLANELIERLIQLAMKKEQREFEFLCMTAEERYLKMLETSPELIESVTQNDLAKYLGITPVGLSRIKKRVT